MRAIIGARLLASEVAQPRAAPFEILDERLPGFLLRVQPSGARAYYAQLGRGRRVSLAKVGVLTPDEARERCQKVLGNAANGRDPFHGIEGTSTLTLGQFIKDTFDPWRRANKPETADRELGRISSVWGHESETPLEQITVETLENWKIDRMKSKIAATTISRDLAMLSTILTRAVKLGKLKANIIRNVEMPKIDRNPKVRYLSEDENKSLRAALRARDEEMREGRASGNRWRKERGEEPYPDYGEFVDYLEPAAIVSLNTGIRRGELQKLIWSDVDFSRKTLMIRGKTAKSKQTRYVPLNTEALDALKRWKKDCTTDRIFTVGDFKTAWTNLMKRAGIRNFRWHDMRHDFASRLASKGVPLNTIRELLGHGSMAMTLRYAHLQPSKKSEAVALLVEG